MKVNTFSYLSYKELRYLLKENPDNYLLRLECAYKNPNVRRSLFNLSKMENNLPEKEARLAKEYYFFRMLSNANLNEIYAYGSSLLKEKDDELIKFVLAGLQLDILNLSKEDLITYNHFLYFLLYYVAKNIPIDFAYELPNDKYSKAHYLYSLYMKVYGLGAIRNASKCFRKFDENGIRSFINIEEREMLSLIQRNPFLSEKECSEFINIKGSYPTIRKLSVKEKEDVIISLTAKECVSITQDKKLEITAGGFFLLACFEAQ